MRDIIKTKGNLEKQRQAAIEAVARRFSATWEDGGDPSDASITIAGRRVVLEIATTPGRSGGRGVQARPHLRFDKVAVRLVEHLRATLHDLVPDGMTVLLTITAPIRLASKSVVAMEDKARVLLAPRSEYKRPERLEAKSTIHGNRIRIRVEKTAARPASKVIGFVHNPETDPRVLFDMTHSLLDVFGARTVPNTDTPSELAGARWLVVLNKDDPSHIEAYRYIYSQLGIPANFEKILMTFGGGRVEALR
jgi:hypothetical protein